MPKPSKFSVCGSLASPVKLWALSGRKRRSHLRFVLLGTAPINRQLKIATAPGEDEDA